MDVLFTGADFNLRVSIPGFVQFFALAPDMQQHRTGCNEQSEKTNHQNQNEPSHHAAVSILTEQLMLEGSQ